jgi:hypothetical protein
MSFKRVSSFAALGVGVLALATGIAVAVGACSSSSATSGGGTGDGGGGASCATSALQIVFSPMYTGWDGVHNFQVPAVVKGVKATDVTWNASDTTLVSLVPDPTSGGVMITVNNSAPLMVDPAQMPKKVTITAQANGQCGSSVLTITPAREADDWHDGALRYNDGVDLRPAADAGSDGGVNKQVACTYCHGDSANGSFKDVSHTPEQIGGFSDDDLEKIIRQGIVPAGGYFDTTIVSQDQWHSFHQWQMTDEELFGLLVYLRSLPPKPQTGSANFGGQLFGDGG